MKTSALSAPFDPSSKSRRRKTVCSAVLAVSGLLLPVLTSRAEITVTTDHTDNDAATKAFHFKTVRGDLDGMLDTSISTTLLEGQQDDASASSDVLFDGQGPDAEDQPDQNFFFKDGDDGGRLLVTFGEAIPINEVDTYSWHPGTRAPQVYKLYGSDGSGEGFVAEPKRPQDPATCGWKLLAAVDTRQKFGNSGGQYGVSVTDPAGAVGKYRYLLFDVSRTEGDDDYGNTFYSEINVFTADASPDKANAMTPAAEPKPEEPAKTIPGAGASANETKRTVWLGVLCDEMSNDLRDFLPLPSDTGLVVRGVPPNGPASKAGLQEHDVLTKLDDQLLVNTAQLQALVRGKHDGDTVSVSYLRRGQPGTAEAKLATLDVPVGNDNDAPNPVIPQEDIEDQLKALHTQGQATGTIRQGADKTLAVMNEALEALNETLHEQGLDDKAIEKIDKRLAEKMANSVEKEHKPTGEINP